MRNIVQALSLFKTTVINLVETGCKVTLNEGRKGRNGRKPYTEIVLTSESTLGFSFEDSRTIAEYLDLAVGHKDLEKVSPKVRVDADSNGDTEPRKVHVALTVRIEADRFKNLPENNSPVVEGTKMFLRSLIADDLLVTYATVHMEDEIARARDMETVKSYVYNRALSIVDGIETRISFRSRFAALAQEFKEAVEFAVEADTGGDLSPRGKVMASNLLKKRTTEIVNHIINPSNYLGSNVWVHRSDVAEADEVLAGKPTSETEESTASVDASASVA